MIHLFLSILSSAGIFLLFKLFDRFKVNNLQAIVVNYFAACATGLILYKNPINIGVVINEPWFFGAFILGFLFIAVFMIMALTAQKNGLSVASVAGKMSVIIPVVFGLIVYSESINIQKSIGIILALFAVYYTANKSKKSPINSSSFKLPVLLFLGTGIIDTTIKYLETTQVKPNDIPIFSSTIFLFAGCIGITILGYKIITKKTVWQWKSLIAGLFLGTINYFSVFYLLKALNHKDLESSTIFTINNVAVVMITTLIGVALFKERLTQKNWIGIILAILSIVLVTLA
ncbi:MAG: hypothetical protein BM564_07160 [Bacteroidetes bacterium MedPE-SWsnd-G2]|nr:MAG: hypothetical protein BM564_07160 [Bacteroidetes bacterium MedPE-SWsnd-G2]